MRFNMGVKSQPCGFLHAKKMPMKKHEMIYVFYKKLPFYDLSSHTHNFLKDDKIIKTDKKSIYSRNDYLVYKKRRNREYVYNPPLPNRYIRD